MGPKARHTGESTPTSVEAFAAFAEHAAPRLRRALVALYGVDVGQDAAAEALAEGWRRWDRVAAMENPVGYLYTIGRNCGRRRAPGVAPGLPVPPHDHLPWIEPALPAALTALPERQRQAVMLVHAHGWTLSEAAEVLGVSKNTVRIHVDRGVAKLRAAGGDRVSSPIPTLREYGAYLESLDRPLDIGVPVVADRRSRPNGGATPSSGFGPELRLLRAAPGVSSARDVVDVQPTPRARPGRRRRLVAAAAVAAALLLVVGAVVLRSEGGNHVRTTPAGPGPTSAVPTTVPEDERPPPTVPGDESTTGALLPDGVPSTPHVGDLVASVKGQYALYADGRLISWHPPPGRAQFERRLSPEGVERVRREFLASGLFDPASTRDVQAPCTCVRGDDGRLLEAKVPPTADSRLGRYVEGLEASLPETEWVEKQQKPYVASRIQVCVATYVDVPDRVVPVRHDLSALVPLLPARTAQLMGGAATGAPFGAPDSSCVEATLDDARVVRDELLDASVGGSHRYWGIVLRDARFAVIKPDATQGIVAFFSFAALLPDGVPFGG